MMMDMTDAHRLFLQHFISKGILNATEVKNLFHYSCDKFKADYNDDQLAIFVLTINDHIKPMHLEIKKGICEQSEVHYYGMVNTAESEVTLCSSDYSVVELEFFKKLIDRIVSNDGSLPSTEALNIVHEVEKFSKKAADELLEKLTREKWLIKTSGRYSLSVRSILELDHYIEEVFREQVTKCDICKKLVVQGQSCSQCDVKLHLYCARRWMQDKNVRVCPDKRCAAQWPHNIPAKQQTPKKQNKETGEGTSGANAAPTGRKRSTRN